MPRNNPPAPPVTGPVFRLAVHTRQAGTTAITTHDYMLGTFPGSIREAMIAFVAAFADNVLDPYSECLTPESEINKLVCHCITSEVIANVESTTFRAGVAIGEPLPNQVAAVCIKRSPLKGQHGRGRFSMPFVPLGFVGAGAKTSELKPFGFVKYQVLCEVLQGQFTAGGSLVASPVVSTRPPAPGGIVLDAAPTSAQFPTVILGSARSRKPGRGI